MKRPKHTNYPTERLEVSYLLEEKPPKSKEYIKHKLTL